MTRATRERSSTIYKEKMTMRRRPVTFHDELGHHELPEDRTYHPAPVGTSFRYVPPGESLGTTRGALAGPAMRVDTEWDEARGEYVDRVRPALELETGGSRPSGRSTSEKLRGSSAPWRPARVAASHITMEPAPRALDNLKEVEVARELHSRTNLRGDDIKDAERKFDTGAVRSADADDTRFDLIPPAALFALAATYGEGATKYGDSNYLKGIPYSVMLNHLQKHIAQWMLGDRSEDHLAHAAWGLLSLIVFEDEGRTELNDLYTWRAGR